MRVGWAAVSFGILFVNILSGMSVIIRNYQGRKSKCSVALKYQTVFFYIFPHIASRRYDRPKLQTRDQQATMVRIINSIISFVYFGLTSTGSVWLSGK